MSKGSAPRPFEVDHQTFSNNYDAIFGKKSNYVSQIKDAKHCSRCGSTDPEMHRQCQFSVCAMKESK